MSVVGQAGSQCQKWRGVRLRLLLAPVAIIAEALGYSPRTIEAHATASAADYARYVSALLDDGQKS
jgi:DMSO/TMAO reductase YedYZ molybdopterin-dependent catalytic subunit